MNLPQLTSRSALSDLLDSIKTSEAEAQGLLEGIAEENRHLKQASVVQQEFKLLQEKNEDSAQRLATIKTDLGELRTAVQRAREQTADARRRLADFEQSVEAAEREQPNYAVYLNTQADSYMNRAKEQAETVDKQYNYARKNAE